MSEQEIFEKLKEALDYEYLCTDFGGKEVTNLEEYLYAIKMERSLEKEFDQITIDTQKTYVEFILKLVSGIICVVLNILLIPNMGLVGVGIATLSANFVYFLLSVIITLPNFRIKLPIKVISQML